MRCLRILALDEAAKWMIAAYGGLDGVSMTLEGYHYFGPCTEYHAICIVSVEGAVLDQTGGDGPTALVGELQAVAEFLVARMVPGLCFTHKHWDLQEHGLAQVRRHDLSAHERLALIARHGALDQVRAHLPVSM